jgi:gliding motility-associated-like protein
MIPNFSGNVYALSFDPARQLLYAAGDGFVGSFDISAYCTITTPSASYTLSVLGSCSNVTASLSPVPPSSASVTYTLLNGSTVVATNTSGLFNGVSTAGNYMVKADIDMGCSDITESANVLLGSLTLGTQVQDACGGPGTGALTVTTGGLTGSSYSINGSPAQADSVFPHLDAGNYTVVVDGPNNGCSASVSVVVNSSDLMVKATGAGTVCAGSPIALQGITNGTNGRWTPSAGLSDSTVAYPLATPPATTKYYFEATQGTCTLADSVVITVNPLPVADAGPDITVCFGVDATLQGSGGGSYSWSPGTYLNNTAIAEPRVEDPRETVSYFLRVTDAQGCVSPPDTVSVHVAPLADISVGNDTTILTGQTVQLHATDVNGSGFTSFAWSPSAGLNDPAVQNPMADPGATTTYTVTASTPQGCEASASIKVTVVKGVMLLVPGAFTPDGNGHNEVLRVLSAGIKELKYFVVFNRWGQEVFRTSNLADGWDGRTRGESMPAGTYVWSVEAVDLTGRVQTGKGTVILVR